MKKVLSLLMVLLMVASLTACSGGSDYSEGSEWEEYDSDSDGQISDSEFQDATDDYMTENGY